MAGEKHMSPPTISAEIDGLYVLRQQKQAAEAQLKQLDQEIREQERRVLDALDAQELTQSAGRTAKASISESVVPSVTDWDEFYKFIHRNNYWHLLERRPSVSGCRELFETKGVIPGVQPFTKRRVNVRAVSDE